MFIIAKRQRRECSLFAQFSRICLDYSIAITISVEPIQTKEDFAQLCLISKIEVLNHFGFCISISILMKAQYDGVHTKL